MVKVFAPHPATHNGVAVEINKDGSAEVSDEAFAELVAHGYRRWTEKDDDRLAAGDPEDPENMSRAELIAVLKGRTDKNVMLLKNVELVELAKSLASSQTGEGAPDEGGTNANQDNPPAPEPHDADQTGLAAGDPEDATPDKE